MEPHLFTVNSPRATRCLLKRRNNDKQEEFQRSDAPRIAAGAKQSEVYGFVGAITTVIATVVFLVWAYTPEAWLHRLGITYYPSKYWALAIPAYAMITVASMIGTYIASNFMITVPPTSLNTIFDEHTREASIHEVFDKSSEKPIEPISDIHIDWINNLMFGNGELSTMEDDN